jgi:protein-L-isoaspartate O-methyltransferase
MTTPAMMLVEAGHNAATEAAIAVCALGLDDRVHVIHGDGYADYPDGAPYDRIIVTCGIAGIPPQWLNQLAPEALIIAPVAHAGVHPVLAVMRPRTHSRSYSRSRAPLNIAFHRVGVATRRCRTARHIRGWVRRPCVVSVIKQTPRRETPL